MNTKSISRDGGSHHNATPRTAGSQRFLGIDVGAETIKVVEVRREGAELRLGRKRLAEHHKEPAPRLLDLLGEFDWPNLGGAAVSGRLARLVKLPRVPTKQAQARGFRFLSSKITCIA